MKGINCKKISFLKKQKFGKKRNYEAASYGLMMHNCFAQW